jgi:hypothetical protein
MAHKKDIQTVSVIRGRSDPSRKADEESEKVEVMGQESDTKAVKWVQEENKEVEKKEVNAQAVARQILEDQKEKEFNYRTALLKELLRQQSLYDIPSGFKWGAKLDTKGLVMWIKARDGNYAAVGLKISGKPMYDMNWIDRRLNDAIGLMERLDKNVATDIHEKKTPGGIILPK